MIERPIGSPIFYDKRETVWTFEGGYFISAGAGGVASIPDGGYEAVYTPLKECVGCGACDYDGAGNCRFCLRQRS